MPSAWDNIPNQSSNNTSSNLMQEHINANKPVIAITIPYNGRFEPEWVTKSYIPLCYTGIDWCTKARFLCKVPSLPLARDTLVDSALKSGCTHIFFLDTDIIFEQPTDPNIALKTLYQVINKDPNSKEGKIVSGLYRAKQKQGFNYAMWVDAPNGINGFIPIEKWTGNWFKVDVCGMGCCLIDIRVFKDIPKPYFHWELQGEMSEDFHFCKLAAKHGYDTHIFSDVRLSHLGAMKVKCDGTFEMPEM